MLGNADDSANTDFVISDGISQGTWRQSVAAIWESFFRLPDGTSQVSRQMAAAIWEYKGKWGIEFQDMSVISHVAAKSLIRFASNMIYFFLTKTFKELIQLWINQLL